MGSAVAPQFTIEPPDQTKFEIEPPAGSAPSTSGTGFWAHVGQSIRSMAPEDIPSFTDVLKAAGESALGPGAQALKALHGAATEYAAARERGHGVPYSTAAGASTAVGVSPERMEQAASQGDTAGVLGEAAVPTALALAPLAAEGAGKLASDAGLPSAIKETVGAAKPDIVKRLDKAHSLSGQAAAYIAEKVLPDSPSSVQAAADAEKTKFENAQQRTDAIFEKAKADAAKRDAAQAARQQRQQAQQTSTSSQQSQASPVVQPDSSSLPPSEGRPATWPNQTVLQRAGTGDITAIQQARLRGLDLPANAGLVANKSASITPSVGTPRSVTVFDANGNPIGPAPPSLPGGPATFNRLSLSDGEDLGPGMGTDHIIRDRNGNRVGSIQVEPKGDNTVHVHWLGGEFGPSARGPLTDAIKDQYPGTERITYDRRRLAAGAKAATTTPREMSLP